VSVDPALTNAEIAALAGPSIPKWFMVHDTTSGNTVATARVNMVSITYPLATITVDGTSAGWSSVAPDMVIFIGSSAGSFNRGIYRVRKNGTATTLEIMAIGQNDSGEINLALRNTGISDDDYITVLNRFDIFGAYPRIAYSGVGTDASIYEDWDKTPDNFNRYPAPIVNLIIDGQPANYATHVYGNASKTFNIDLAITLWPTSSSVTWAIVLPSGWTLNSGSLTGSTLTATINVTAPHSANAYTLAVEAVENHGNPFFAYRKVWIKSNTYPPISIVRFDSDVDDRTGSRATITLNSLVGMPPGAMVHLFDMGNWNGSDVPTARKCLTGYVQRRKETAEVGVTGVSLDIVGPSYVMEQIGGQSQIMSAVGAAPNMWQQLYYTLSYLDFVIWWVMWQRGRGLLQMFNYTPFGLSNTSHRMTDWRIDAGSLLSQVQALTVRYGGGNFGCDATGEFILRRNLSRIPWASRSGIPTRCIINASIYSHLELDYDEHPHVRRLRGECFVSDGLTTSTPFWCDAVTAPGQGTGEEKLERLICNDEAELLSVTGDEYQARNNPYPSGSLTVQKNYAVVKPAQMLPIQTDIPSWLRYDDVAYSALQLPIQVTYTHNADGTIDTQIAFETETVGVPATAVPIPAPDPTTYSSPYQSIPFAPIPPYLSNNPNPAGTPAGPVVIPKTGSVDFLGTGIQAFLATNFLGTPSYRDITPGDLGAYIIKHGIWVVGTNVGYLLAADGTNSAIWHTLNLFDPAPTWSKGADFTGTYNELASAGVAAQVLAYGPASGAGGTGPVNITYAAGSGPSSFNVGDTITVSQQNIGGSPTSQQFVLTLDRCCMVQWISGDVKDSGSGSCFTDFSWGGGGLGGCGTAYYLANCPTPASTVNIHQGETWATSKMSSTAQDTTPGGPFQIKLVSILNGGAAVRYSSNCGATVGSAVSVGTTPGGLGGFDVQRLGAVSYAAASNKIRKATSPGGSYSDLIFLTTVNAICIEQPWYTRNSLSALNSGSSPEFIYVLDMPDGSGHTMFWVVSGTPINITPVIGGNPGVAVGQNCVTTWSGKYIAAVLSFAGVIHSVTSIDGGSTWIDRGAVSVTYIRVRRKAAAPGQLFMAGSALDYSANFGALIIPKPKPDSEFLEFIEPIG
jgi:hypothetical protein